MAKVIVKSRLQAIQHSQLKEIPSCIIVSITEGKGHTPSFYRGDGSQVKDVFPLFFDDIDREHDGYKACQEEDFKGLRAFIDKWKDKVDEIIVHCHAGISRSSGCAAAICQYIGIDDTFIWDSGQYIPNRRVYKFARMEFGILRSEKEMQELFKRADDAQVRKDLFNDLFLGDWKER